MSLLNHKRARPTPWHLWVVGLLSLAWNAFGAFDFTMTQTRNAGYMARFSQQQLDYFQGLPTWVVIGWGIAVFGGVLGSLFLLWRKRLAVWLFFLSLLAVIATDIHSLLLSDGLAVMGGAGALWLTAAIFVIAVALFLYAGIMNRRYILH